jgi:hypothetical protein
MHLKEIQEMFSQDIKIRIYGTIILLVFQMGGETWSVPLREEQRLRVFKNWVLRKYSDIRGSK